VDFSNASAGEGSEKGSEFIVRLPRLPGEAVEAEPAVPPGLAARHRLLIIDDDRERERARRVPQADVVDGAAPGVLLCSAAG